MPGYPCCCVQPSGDLWDIYWGLVQPHMLDMVSTCIQTYANQVNDTDKHRGSNNLYVDLYTPSYYDLDDLDDYHITAVNNFPEEKPRTIDVIKHTDITLNLSNRGMNEIEETNTKGIHQFTASGGHCLASIRDYRYFFVRRPINLFNTYDDYPTEDRQKPLAHFGMVNLRKNPETVFQAQHILTTGDLITSSTVEATGFDVYYDFFQINWDEYDHIDHYTFPWDGYEPYPGYSIQHTAKWRPEDGYTSVFVGDAENYYYALMFPEEFQWFGSRANCTGSLLAHTEPYVFYDKGAAASTMYYWDIFGSGDCYVGTTATYSTGNGRYELDHPYYTGVSNYIVHALDMPAEFYDTGTFGFVSGHPLSGGMDNFHISGTGVYLSLFNYLELHPLFVPPTLTGIYRTGTFDYFLNVLNNQTDVQNYGKLTPPLIASFTDLDETAITNAYRSWDGDYRHIPIVKTSITIKPDECRQFYVHFNEPSYHARAQFVTPGGTENLHAINSAFNGKLGYKNKIETQFLISFTDDKVFIGTCEHAFHTELDEFDITTLDGSFASSYDNMGDGWYTVHFYDNYFEAPGEILDDYFTGPYVDGLPYRRLTSRAFWNLDSVSGNANFHSDMLYNKWVELGTPPCAEMFGYYYQFLSSAQKAAYVTQCETIYQNLLDLKLNSTGVDYRGSQTGYNPFDKYQDRTIYIQPYNVFLGNNSCGYFGEDKDGFNLSGATVAFYHRDTIVNLMSTNISTEEVNTGVQTSDMIDAAHDRNTFLVDNVNISNITGAGGIIPYLQNPLELGYIDCYNGNSVFIFDKYPNPRESDLRDNTYIARTLKAPHINPDTIIADINTNVFATGIGGAAHTGYYGVTESIRKTVEGYQYDVDNNTGIRITGHDFNYDCAHYFDKLAMKDESALSTTGLYPAIIDTSEGGANLVLVCDDNCYPKLWHEGDTISDIGDYQDRVTYHYAISTGWEVQPINKFRRYHPDYTGLAELTGDMRNPNVHSSVGYTDEYREVDFLVPTVSKTIATTTIFRPTGIGNDIPVECENSSSHVINPECWLTNISPSLLGANINALFSPLHDLPGGHKASLVQLYLDETDRLYISSGDYTGTVFQDEFNNPDPISGVSFIRPVFIDAFVYYASPLFRAFGRLADVDDVGDVIRDEGVSLKAKWATLGYGGPPEGSVGTSYIDYVHVFEDNFEEYNQMFVLTGDFTDITQVPTRPHHRYKWDEYNGNSIIYYVQEHDNNTQLNEKRLKRSLKVNDDYIFENVSGVSYDDIDVKVGPNHAVYVLKGEISGGEYYPYRYRNSSNKQTWCYLTGVDGALPYPPESGIPTCTVHVVDLEGTEVFSWDVYSQYTPYCFGMTDEHFYMKDLLLDHIVDPSDFSEDDIAEEIVTSNGYYRVLTHSGSLNQHDTWRINYDGSYFSPCNQLDGSFYNNWADFYVNDDVYSSSSGLSQRLLFNSLMITHNDQITDAPQSTLRNPIAYKTIDSTHRFYTYDSSVPEYVASGDIASFGWQPGPNCFISDGQEVLLNSFPYTGDGVYIYKHMALETGKSYCLSLGFTNTSSISPAFGAVPEWEYFTAKVSISGVKGADNEYLLCEFYGDGHTISGFDDTTTTTNNSYPQNGLLYFTVESIDDPNNSPVILSINTMGEPELQTEYTGSPNLPWITLYGATLHEGMVTGTGSFEYFTGIYNYPYIRESGVV